MKKIIPLIFGIIFLISNYIIWSMGEWGASYTFVEGTSFFSSAGLFSPLGIIGIILVVIGLMMSDK